MPPGGHVDANERPDECARRECKEETGLDVEIIGDAQPDLFAGAPDEGSMLKRPFAMLLENIPAFDKPINNTQETFHEPAHEHMDFLYLAKPLDETQALQLAEAEADHLKWFTAGEIDTLKDDEIFANVRAYVKMLIRQ